MIRIRDGQVRTETGELSFPSDRIGSYSSFAQFDFFGLRLLNIDESDYDGTISIFQQAGDCISAQAF